MSKLQPKLRLEAVVDRIFPFGVFVRLEDGTPAYIRRRELALDQDIDPAAVVQKGQRISAIVIRSGDEDKLPELSRRQTLEDPWPSFTRQFGVGDAVRGSVRAVMPHGVYIRIMAGVNGYIPLEELAPWKIEKPEDLLWVEDYVEAIIMEIDLANKQALLSIKSRFQTFERALETYQHLSTWLEATPQPTLEPRSSGHISPTLREQLGPLLVVDDDESVRRPLANWLSELGLEVSQASTLAAAKAFLQEKSYQAIFMDLNLGREDGLELAQASLINKEKKPYLCVMSSPHWLQQRGEEIAKAGVTHIFPKPLDMEDIENFLVELAYQKVPVAQVWGEGAVAQREFKESGPFRELQGLDQLASHPFERLKTILTNLTESLRASLGIVFSLDILSNTISILAHAGSLPIHPEAIYQLGDSPVKDVMVGNLPIFETQMNASVRARFRKLLELISFEACIGIPIQIQQEGRYAVFFFHHEPNAFSRFRLRDAQAGAWLLTALLEEESLNQRLHVLHPLLLSGQLAASFGHEISNKMIGLELKARKLASAREGSPSFASESADLLKTILDLKEMVSGFQDLMRRPGTRETFEINACLNAAKSLLTPVMRKENVKLEMHLASNLPHVSGNRNALQQVFLNLMLNAIQQMSGMGQQHELDSPRLLELRTELSQDGSMIYVQFHDSGPGIHQRLWKKIFSPGFSTRGGSGLGLYIAESILHSFQGRIFVEESVIPLGTTFRVELPVSQEGDERWNHNP